MKCKAIRAFYLAGALVEKDKRVEVPDGLVHQLEAAGKVVRAPDAPKPAKVGPLTTAAAPGLVSGTAKGDNDVVSSA